MKFESGFAFILALFLLLFISLLFVSMFNLLTTDLQITAGQRDDATAFYIAEAGIEEAIRQLRDNSAWTANGTVTAFSQGQFTLTYPADATPGLIRSIGRVGTHTRRIDATVNITGEEPPFTVEITDWNEELR